MGIDDINKSAKEYLAEWRERIRKAGWTQEQVSELTGISASTLSLYIAGKQMPTFPKFWLVETLLLQRGV